MYMYHWRSELTKCFAVLHPPLTTVFLSTQNGGVVSGFLSTVQLTFSYVRYCKWSTQRVYVNQHTKRSMQYAVLVGKYMVRIHLQDVSNWVLK